MKRGIICAVLGLFILVLSVAFAGAVAVPKTVITGKIYDGPNFESALGVADAIITVTCGSYEQNTTSKSDGTYMVAFENFLCPLGSDFVVLAMKNGISSSDSAKVEDHTNTIGLYLGVANIALIPEFGAVVGIMTVISAVGIFFFIKKK